MGEVEKERRRAPKKDAAPERIWVRRWISKAVSVYDEPREGCDEYVLVAKENADG